MARQVPPSDRTPRLLQTFRTALSFQAQGRAQEAGQLYESILKADGRQFGAAYRLGLIRLHQNKFEEALRLFRRAVKIEPNSAEACHYLAFVLTALKRCEEAVSYYRKALALQPGVPEAHNNFGHALQVLRRFDQAIEQYERALILRPAYAEAENNLGNVLHLLDQSADAVAHYEKALAIRPAYAEAHWNLGNALVAIGRAGESTGHYEKAIAIRPDYAEAHNSLGNQLHKAERSEEAIPCYERALALAPDYADAHINLGVALWAVGRHKEAISHYEKALLAAPDYIEKLGRNDALTALVALSNLQEAGIAIDVLVQLDKLAGNDVREKMEFDSIAAFVRAAALDKAGRYAEAWEILVPANHSLFTAGQMEFAETIERQDVSLARVRRSRGMTTASTIDSGQTISLFIVGASRAGKTTMETLVSALDGVKRGYESLIVENTARRACQEAALPTRTRFEDLPATLYPLCRDIYKDELGRRGGSSVVYTNTHPIRIHDAELIARIFPNVRFICVKRNVEDHVWRMYMTKYEVGNIHSYDIQAAYRHIGWYNEMMDVLAQKLPTITRVIHYEDMVADSSAALRMAAELCRLTWADAPLPDLGDDRNCSIPYRRFMSAETTN